MTLKKVRWVVYQFVQYKLRRMPHELNMARKLVPWIPSASTSLRRLQESISISPGIATAVGCCPATFATTSWQMSAPFIKSLSLRRTCSQKAAEAGATGEHCYEMCVYKIGAWLSMQNPVLMLIDGGTSSQSINTSPASMIQNISR